MVALLNRRRDVSMSNRSQHQGDYKAVERESPGNERTIFFMEEIQKGAKAFLKKEYQWVSVFVIIMMVLLAVVLAVVIAPLTAVTHLLGAS